jgi:HD-GYP domain-containing protein (c-di-GMP phosphodiesterase class II)
MYDELMLEAMSDATIEQVSASQASYLQRVIEGFKTIGQRHRADGAEALVKHLKRVRPNTYYHSVRTSRLARVIGRAFSFDDAQMKELSYAAVLHDSGKILIPEAILSRPRKPTRTELFILHKHPTFGSLLALYFKLSPELRIRTQCHHERWDGRGYPNRLCGEAIPFMSRIVQVADTFDAMVATDRAYRQPLAHDEAITELRRHAGKQFDPRIIEAFADTFPACAIA